MHKKSQTSLLTQAHSKYVKNLNKCFYEKKNAGLLLFVEHLKYLKDLMIIESLNDEVNQVKLATINTAIAEFDAYQACRDARNKVFHWNNFCELLKQNMEEWLGINDSI